MTLILSYIVAAVLSYFVIMGAVVILAVPFKFLIVKYNSFLPTSFFLTGFVGGAGWVWTYSILSQHTFLKLTYFMIVLPSIYWILFGIWRVDAAKQGLSGQKRIMDMMGDSEHYDQEADIRHERIADNGRLSGFVVGMVLFIGNAPFFYYSQFHLTLYSILKLSLFKIEHLASKSSTSSFEMHYKMDSVQHLG